MEYILSPQSRRLLCCRVNRVSARIARCAGVSAGRRCGIFLVHVNRRRGRLGGVVTRTRCPSGAFATTLVYIHGLKCSSLRYRVGSRPQHCTPPVLAAAFVWYAVSRLDFYINRCAVPEQSEPLCPTPRDAQRLRHHVLSICRRMPIHDRFDRVDSRSGAAGVVQP